MTGVKVRNALVEVFEFEALHSGTQAIARVMAGCKGFTLAGDWVTIAVIKKSHVVDQIDYISTAGGSFLESVEGKELPALRAFE